MSLSRLSFLHSERQEDHSINVTGRYCQQVYAPFLRRALISTAIAVAAAGVCAVTTAHAAQSPGWRIVKIVRHCGNDSMLSVTATGPRDAWALGVPDGSGPGCGADVEHWGGASWRHLPVPKTVSVSAEPLLGPPVAASSARDAWIFPTRLASSHSSVFSYDYALRWDGAGWRTSAFPAPLTVTFAAAFSKTDVWAFGGLDDADGTVVPYAARYDGDGWHKAVVPVAPLGISALSAHNMWAVGPTPETAAKPLARQVILAAHWTGRRWRTMRVPVIKAPKGTGALSSGQVAAVGPDDIWWAYRVTAREPSRTGLLRWYHGRWHAIKLPAAIAEIDAITQDGHGGVWLLAEAGTAFDNLAQYLYHYNHGSWTRQLVPSPRRYSNMLFGMDWIPRTASVWAAGEADRNYGNESVGVIARYVR